MTTTTPDVERGLAARHLLASSLDLPQVLERVTETSLELLGADLARVWVVDEAAGRLRLAATRGHCATDDLTHGLAEVALDHPLVVAILGSRAPRYSPPRPDDPFQMDRDWIHAGGPAARMVVPLVVGDRALGVLAVLAAPPRRFTDEECRRVAPFAAEAAIALENARLYAETRQRLRQTETLLAVGRAVNSTLDFGEAMRRVARETGRALGADMVGAYLADPDREVLRPVAGYHVPPELIQEFLKVPFRLETNPYIAEGWRSQQAAWCRDAQTDPRSDPELTRWIPMRSVIFCPLTAKDVPFGGLFAIWWTERATPTPIELSLIEGIANQTALAIENARLFEERSRDAQRLQALNQVSQTLAAIRAPREVFATIARFASELLDAPVVRLWVLDPAARELAIVASTGDEVADGAPAPSAARVPPGAGLIGAIFETKRSEFIVDVREDPRGLVERPDLRGFAGVPLVLEDDVVGVLSVLTRRRGGWSPAERSLVEAFASQAALAIHNARVFERMERSLHESQALLAVTESFSEAREIGEIMRRVCREATRALGADSAVFYTVDEEGDRVVPVAGYHIPRRVLEYARPMTVAEVPPVFITAFRTQRIVFVRDAAIEAPLEGPAFEGLTLRSMLCCPVRSKDRTFGCLVLYWWEPVGAIGDGDLALMAALSAQAALALENGRLLEETQSHATALREKNVELDSFVYTVTHDLKSPLVTIQGMADLVLEEHAAGLSAQGRHYLERIRVNTGHMERLLLDLLALSRVGREARTPEAIGLAEVVEEILVELAEPLRARGIKVLVGDDLPTVWAIRVQMEQVWRNLLTNAVKYMGDAPDPVIEIGAVDRGARTECWVRDTGIGIDPAYHRKVFEIFERLKDIEAEGTGVGLPIVKKIVDAAGGHIGIESARGHGSTFRFTWPAGPRS